MQPDLHLAFTPPDTDCRSIAKLIFDETSETLFSDWVKHWLDMKKGIVEQSTYEGYLLNAKHIIEYFSDKKLRLVDLKPLHFEEYYHLMLTEDKTNPNLRIVMNRYQREKELFVWDDGRPIAPDYVYHHFKKLVTEFGRPDMTFHALRHSTASILAAKGWHPREIQEWLRHADFYTTMNIYTHLDSKALIERSERLAGVLNTRVG